MGKDDWLGDFKPLDLYGIDIKAESFNVSDWNPHTVPKYAPQIKQDKVKNNLPQCTESRLLKIENHAL